MQEFDVIDQISIPARGRLIVYSSDRQSTGALCQGSNKIEVKADGSVIGTLNPGESIKLEKPASRWEVKTLKVGGYAKVIIGMGDVQFIGSKGVQLVDRVLKTDSGNEWMASLKSIPSVNKFAYAAVKNIATNKVAVLSNITIFSENIADLIVSTGYPINSIVEGVALNKHGGISSNSWGMFHRGSTVEFDPNPSTEITISSSSYFFMALENVKSKNIINEGNSPIMLVPGQSFIVRSNLKDNTVGMSCSGSYIDYGPR